MMLLNFIYKINVKNLKTIQFVILILLFINTSAQKQTENWYFGNNAGINFNTGIAEPVTNGALVSYEGCASISDSLGNLLFYTNGVTVWNKNHQIMQNGNNLLGDTSSTQSALIVPKPGTSNLYYIFTTDDILLHDDTVTTDGLRYTIVDINANGGSGIVTSEKNILLHDTVPEKITAVQKLNTNDYWLISHGWNNNNFLVWLIDENGISSNPIVSSVGRIQSQIEPTVIINSIGQLKVSPDGTKIAQILLRSSVIEVFDFDNNTGIVSNPFEIEYTLKIMYGTEFSPDCTKLYYTVENKLYQIDLTATSISGSETLLFEGEQHIGGLQLAPDGKIYLAVHKSEYLGVINNPNEAGTACNFVRQGLYLDGRLCRQTLPGFVQNYFIMPEFTTTNNCFGDNMQFLIKDVTGIDSVNWDFGEPASGTSNSSKLLSPTHQYSNAGTYLVKLQVWKSLVESNYQKYIKVVDLPEALLGNDTIVCYSDSLLLDAYNPHFSYEWQDASTDSVYIVHNSGEYYINITNTYTGCKNSDTINVMFSSPPEINLGNDSSFCENTVYTLNAFHNDYEYKWQDGSTNSTYSTADTGYYHVEVTYTDGCKNSDTIHLSHYYLPRFAFPKDTVLCDGDDMILLVPLNETTFLWQDNSVENEYYVADSGQYKLTTTNKCGTWSDSINVSYKYCGEVYVPNVFTPQNDGVNDYFSIKGIEEQVWELVIYSRWGNLVFQTENYKNNWQAANCQSGIYYYILSKPNTNEVVKGFVHVIK